ncbi:MAG TPA: hypothetical protein VFT69_03375 [Pseudolabrys sp.]|nr:hypothetical protein [Pseudolabrys sp.]
MKWILAAALGLTIALPAAAFAQQTPKMTKQKTSATRQVTVKVRQKEPYGSYLTNGRGRALYVFMADSKGESTCYDKCAQAWPPLLGNAKAGKGVQASKLGTTKRKNGRTQVTYNGMPLYYFVKDKGARTTAGEDIKGFGAEWYLVSPQGSKVEGKKS